MTTIREARKAAKALDLYEKALNAVLEVARTTGTKVNDDALWDAHKVFRELRLTLESEAGL